MTRQRKINPEIDIQQLSGTEIGKWRIGGKGKINNRLAYFCTCECGKQQLVRASHLVEYRTMQCVACLGKEKRGAKSPHWTGYGEITGQQFGSYRSGAKDRNIEFNVTIEYIWDLFISQNRKCALTDLFLEMRNRDYHNKEGCGVHMFGTASLDRINSKIGYIVGNVQWVHKQINRMKFDIPQNQFINFCKQITKWQRSGRSYSKMRFHEDVILMNRWSEKTLEGSFSKHWKGYKGITGDYWKGVKNSASERNIDFNITIDEVWDIFLKQRSFCGYSGIPLKLKVNCKDKKSTASIDRIDSDKPYSKDNICWVHKIVNKMKNRMSLQSFFEWCAKVSDCQPPEKKDENETEQA